MRFILGAYAACVTVVIVMLITTYETPVDTDDQVQLAGIWGYAVCLLGFGVVAVRMRRHRAIRWVVWLLTAVLVIALTPSLVDEFISVPDVLVYEGTDLAVLVSAIILTLGFLTSLWITVRQRLISRRLWMLIGVGACMFIVGFGAGWGISRALIRERELQHIAKSDLATMFDMNSLCRRAELPSESELFDKYAGIVRLEGRDRSNRLDVLGAGIDDLHFEDRLLERAREDLARSFHTRARLVREAGPGGLVLLSKEGLAYRQALDVARANSNSLVVDDCLFP